MASIHSQDIYFIPIAWILTFRGYDPPTGRFHQIESLSGKFPEWSPYSFAFNNPIGLNDPMGAEPSNNDINDIMNDLWSTENGGSWTAIGTNYFGSDWEAFIAGYDYMDKCDLWGKNGYAASLDDARIGYYQDGGSDPGGAVSNLANVIVYGNYSNGQ